MSPENVSFSNTEIAFRGRTNSALERSRWLFKAVEHPFLVKTGAPIARAALRLGLPIQPLLRPTFFKQFCGGESIADCSRVIGELAKFHVGTILDYSVEGEKTDAGFDATADEIVRTVLFARDNKNVPFCVFKATGIARFDLMASRQAGHTQSPDAIAEWQRAQARFDRICDEAERAGVRIFLDAEETWIQDVIDGEARRLMTKHNCQRAVVFNTIQMYRVDRFAFLEHEISAARTGNFFLGIKLVRGAYMEKERDRAASLGLPSPIQPNKRATDVAYDKALDLCLRSVDHVSLCAGTHNEVSSLLLTTYVEQLGLKRDDPRVYSSQLLGMGDHITYNLADAGYNAAKYVPYGPLEAVFPYLVRRAEENTSISGQTGRELRLIETELRRRRQRGA